MSFLRRQLLTAALTANAIRPVPGFRVGDPGVPGRLAHRRAGAAAAGGDRGRHRRRTCRTDARPPGKRGKRAPGPTRPASPWPPPTPRAWRFLIDQSRRVQKNAEDALVEALGVGLPRAARHPPHPGRARRRPWRSAGQPVPDPRRRGASSSATSPTTPGRQAGPARRLPPRRPTLADAPVLLQVHGGGWTPGQQGPAGHPADAAPRRQGLGLRRDQLPARPAGRLPGPDRRRQAGDRLDPRAHRRVRRRPRTSRSPAAPRAATWRRWRRSPRTTPRGSPASRTPTPRSGRGAALRRLRLRRLDRDPHHGADARPLPRPPGRAAHAGPTTRRSSRPPRRSCGSPRTRRTSSSSTAPATPSSRWPRPGCSSRGCARSPSARSCTPSCPGPSTPSTSSRRSARPTSSARSTATCTGTGTTTAANATRADLPEAARRAFRNPQIT